MIVIQSKKLKMSAVKSEFNNVPSSKDSEAARDAKYLLYCHNKSM